MRKKRSSSLTRDQTTNVDSSTVSELEKTCQNRPKEKGRMRREKIHRTLTLTLGSNAW